MKVSTPEKSTLHFRLDHAHAVKKAGKLAWKSGPIKADLRNLECRCHARTGYRSMKARRWCVDRERREFEGVLWGIQVAAARFKRRKQNGKIVSDSSIAGDGIRFRNLSGIADSGSITFLLGSR